MKAVEKILILIKDNTGLSLELCNYFTGLKTMNGKSYFNVEINDRISESKEYNILKRFSDKHKLISIEPNGINRVSIFIN